MNCPDCEAVLREGATSCRCGWKLTRAEVAQALRPKLFCDTVGCEQQGAVRIGNRILCLTCRDREREVEAQAFCKARGLHTVEDMRAYCMRLARSFGRGGSFETWAKNIRQETVDLIELHGNPSDKQALERLRDHGAIDERNQVVPLEAREALRQARLEEKKRAEAELRERRIVA